MEVAMTTKMWVELLVGSALVGCFAAIMVQAFVWLAGKIWGWWKGSYGK